MSAKSNYFIDKCICNIKRHILAILLFPFWKQLPPMAKTIKLPILFIFFVINLKNNTFAHRAMQRCNPPK